MNAHARHFASVWLAAACVSLSQATGALADTNAVQNASALELKGQFHEAAAILERALDTAAPGESRTLVEFERDRLARIRRDFPYTQEQLFTELKSAVKGLTRGEFDQWVKEGRFDSREIDGQRRFMSASVSNLFFRYPELNPRRRPRKDTTELQKRRLASCTLIREAALTEHTPYVLPKRFRVTMTVTAKPNAAPAGERISAWLPIPRQYPFQGDFELIESTPPPARIADPQSPIRSVFLEQPARKDRAAAFKIVYDYTAYGVCFDLKPGDVRPCDSNDPALKPYLGEGPHVVFTPEIRALSRQIAGEESNPCLKAKKFYDWIAEHIQYSYSIEYSTIRNISDYCRSRGYGDCGQEALLFITLCRLNGIPARWQSGWNTFARDKTIHDWSEIYLAPYGWVPVDPYMGIFAMRYADALTPEQKRQVRDFYFGGLDQYRLAANSDHNQRLDPPKKSMRSDDVDFQRGEMEWGSHNLNFDEYTYELTLKETELPRRQPGSKPRPD